MKEIQYALHVQQENIHSKIKQDVLYVQPEHIQMKEI